MILEGQMAASVARVTEISAKSDTSFEDAINVAVSRASETLRGVTAAWVKEQNVDIEDGRIVAWKVDLLVTFVLEQLPAAGSRTTAPGEAGAGGRAG
jgi:flavin-binding protein dodecin